MITFGDFNFFDKYIIGDIIFEDQSRKQKVNEVSVNKCIKSFSQCHVDLWCKLFFQYGYLSLI